MIKLLNYDIRAFFNCKISTKKTNKGLIVLIIQNIILTNTLIVDVDF